MTNFLSFPPTFHSDINSLLNFIRGGHHDSKTFWETKDSKEILNIKLVDIKFNTEPNTFGCYEICHKNNLNLGKVILKKETLSKFSLTITDQKNGLLIQLLKLKKKQPGLALETAFNEILEKNNRIIIVKNVIEILKNLKFETLELAENKGKEIKITNFFNKLKARLLSESVEKSYLSVENLIHFNNNEFLFFQLSYCIESISNRDKLSAGLELKKKLVILKDRYLNHSLSYREFKIKAINEIKTFKANNPLTTQLNLLNKIMNFIAKWIPNLIFSEKDRLSYFFKDTVHAEITLVERYLLRLTSFKS